MKLKCGIFVIGSLLWDNKGRLEWRTKRLEMSKRKIVNLPIRYGRISKTRNHTYTMVFSKDAEKNMGKAFLIETKKSIDSESLDLLGEESLKLAKAEKIKNNTNNRIYCGWGLISILINPILDDSIKKNILNKWRKYFDTEENIYNNFKENNEESIVNNDYTLNINWSYEFNDFHIILCAVTKQSKVYPSSECIAQLMIENSYFCYFENNLKYGITTFQDNEIRKILKNKIGLEI